MICSDGCFHDYLYPVGRVLDTQHYLRGFDLILTGGGYCPVGKQKVRSDHEWEDRDDGGRQNIIIGRTQKVDMIWRAFLLKYEIL